MSDQNQEESAPAVAYQLVKSDGSIAETSRGFTGSGTATYPNGEVYEGEFIDGIRHGRGHYKYNNGDTFTGNFMDNQKDGLGKLTFAEGGFYHGHFEEGKRSGMGTTKYANGDIYYGNWSEGKKDGQGTYTYATTKYKLKGTWKKGDFAYGEWNWGNGTKYVGNFNEGKQNGRGVWKFSTGTQLEGIYTQTAVPIDDEQDNDIKNQEVIHADEQDDDQDSQNKNQDTNKVPQNIHLTWLPLQMSTVRGQ